MYTTHVHILARDMSSEPRTTTAAPCGDTAPRRRDAAATRARIAAAARACFARHGYDGTTVRQVASDAGVAPNLITRYFGGKAGLFTAATAGDIDMEAVFEGPPGELGHRLGRAVVRRWEAVSEEDPMLVMLRSAGSSDEAAAAMRQFFTRRAMRPLARHLGSTGLPAVEAASRATAVGACITGTLTNRYVVRLEPLASASQEALAAWLGAQLQALLDLPAGSPSLG